MGRWYWKKSTSTGERLKFEKRMDFIAGTTDTAGSFDVDIGLAVVDAHYGYVLTEFCTTYGFPSSPIGVGSRSK